MSDELPSDPRVLVLAHAMQKVTGADGVFVLMLREGEVYAAGDGSEAFMATLSAMLLESSQRVERARMQTEGPTQ